MEDTLFVVNPVSAKGLTGKQWPDLKAQIEKAVQSPIKDILTETESLVPKIVRNALKESIRTIVSVGGDGTHSQVMRGFFEEENLTTPIQPEACLVFMSRGTGGDLCRHFQLGKDVSFVVDSLLGEEQTFDIGLISYLDHQNQPQKKQFINITSIGLSGETALKMKQLKKSAAIHYLFTTLHSALSYQSKPIRLFVDETLCYEGKSHMVAVANGSYFGGGMHIAPKATTSDGLFDVVVVKHLNKLQIFTKISKVYSGKHLGLEQIFYTQGKKIRVESEEKLLLEIDGDPLGMGPIEVQLIPAVLKIRLPRKKTS